MQPDWKQVDLEKVHWLEETRLEAKKKLLPEPKKMEATQGERLHAFLSHLVGLKGWFHLHSRYIVQILVQSHFELVRSLLALEATEPVSQPVTQMAVEMININLTSV